MQTSHEINRQDRQQNPDAFLVNEKDLEELKTICVDKIRVASKNGKLESHPKMVYLLYRWKAWASPKEATQWVEKVIRKQNGLLCFLKTLIQQQRTRHGS